MQVVVGRIGRAHGIRGDVAVEVRTDERERRFVAGATLLTDPSGAGPLVLQSARMHSGRLLAHFEQVDDRTSAEQLRGVILLVDADPDETPIDPDEFYDREVVGLQVVDERRGLIGEVAEVIHLPGQELLAVRSDLGATVLIPFVAAIVKAVDVTSGRVEVDLPDGLLELADE
jgi:16S rRNA processing protein RimM